MDIKKINDFLNFKDFDSDRVNKTKTGDFGQLLKSSLEEVNKMQLESEEYKRRLAIGEVDNLHDVSIVSEKANIALQVTMSIRGKIVEAYKEIMRIQI